MVATSMTLDKASPADVQKQKTKRIKELKALIEMHNAQILKAEAEIEAWKAL